MDQLVGVAKINLASLMEVTALGELPHVEQAFRQCRDSHIRSYVGDSFPKRIVIGGRAMSLMY